MEIEVLLSISITVHNSPILKSRGSWQVVSKLCQHNLVTFMNDDVLFLYCADPMLMNKLVHDIRIEY